MVGNSPFAVLDAIPIEKGEIGGLLVNPNTDELYASYPASDLVSVVNVSTGTVTRSIKVKSPWRMQLNSSTNSLYVQTFHGGTSDISVIDVSSNKVKGTIPLHRTTSLNENHPSVNTSVFCINERRNEIYVTMKGGFMKAGYLLVIDGSTNLEIARIYVEKDPIGVAYNPNSDLVYVANRGSHSISIIKGTHENTNEVIDVKEPYAIAVSPLTNLIYVIRRQGWSVEGAGGHRELFYMVNTESGEISNQLTFITEENGFDVHPSLDALYIRDTSRGVLMKLDLYGKRVMGEITLNQEKKINLLYARGDHVSVNRKTDRIFVADHEAGLIHVLAC